MDYIYWETKVDVNSLEDQIDFTCILVDQIRCLLVVNVNLLEEEIDAKCASDKCAYYPYVGVR